MKKTTSVTMNQLIVFTVILSVAACDYIYYPVKIQTPFKAVPLSNLQCPRHPSERTLRNSRFGKGWILKQNIVDVPGLFVVKQKWKTACHMNFLGIKTIKHEIISEELTATDFTNYTTTPTFPNEECNWMTDTVKETTHFIASRGTLAYDISTGRTADPVYGTHLCAVNYCHLRKDVIFRSDETFKIKEYGFKEILYEVELDQNHQVTESSVIQSRDFHPLSIRGACIDEQNLGGRKFSLIFPNGFYLVLDIAVKSGGLNIRYQTGSDLVARASHRLTGSGGTPVRGVKDKDVVVKTDVSDRGCSSWCSAINGLPVCPTHARHHIRQTGMLSMEFQQERRMLARVESFICREKLHEVRTTKKINAIGLGMFVQRHGGPGPVYRIKNQTLESATGIYKRIFWEPRDDQIGMYYNGTEEKKVTCAEWITDRNGMSCINGIVKYGNKIIHPSSLANTAPEEERLFKKSELIDAYHVPTKAVNPWADWNPMHPPEASRKFIGWNFPDFLGPMKLYLEWVVVGIIGILTLMMIVSCNHRRTRHYY
ncbi:putative envelope glycoprotein [Dillard's Draw virus]|uniref:Putative envelope glycoprotein n=1 Tax=Dillard's Draw virus TaxID=2315722 RepID=A0A385KL07_9RHAB|nr:putative envelope glycoprotein [Dillard's Draw virus]AXZ78338.1 putative envelope glycoprotein [Dillard's Draw virus]